MLQKIKNKIKKLFPATTAAPPKPKFNIIVPSGYVAYFFKENNICVVAQNQRQANNIMAFQYRKSLSNKKTIGKKGE